jgi:transposase-like protein
MIEKYKVKSSTMLQKRITIIYYSKIIVFKITTKTWAVVRLKFTHIKRIEVVWMLRCTPHPDSARYALLKKTFVTLDIDWNTILDLQIWPSRNFSCSEKRMSKRSILTVPMRDCRDLDPMQNEWQIQMNVYSSRKSIERKWIEAQEVKARG